MRAICLIGLVGVMLFGEQSYELTKEAFDTPRIIPKQAIFDVFNPEILQKPQLEMIINQKARINGKWFVQGQQFSQYHITHIQRDSVTLSSDYETITLYTHPPKNSKQPLLQKAKTKQPKKRANKFKITHTPQ
ncbi:hypothetical protein BKH46_05070 [Helicobacter sp. 12S02634-8]|uniref:hypothetical protein n=1 Tax=Helicobacter sp. 12S02634-8 TaxID=1476199 RepID=UPI000BA5EF81|nr:hypothetical protein [Helicobacter sp. 12S02634-8]PAF47091.1 hypothetical protein BKH46_05070 [Helicobacter sp. 12S02634-8]